MIIKGVLPVRYKTGRTPFGLWQDSYARMQTLSCLLIAIEYIFIYRLADYSKDITDLLLRFPEGLPLRKIVRHVYNAHNTFFDTISLEDVSRDVASYLQRRSKTPESPIEHAGTRGFYRLNPDSGGSRQLMLQFQEQQEESVEEQPESPTENPLDLFDGFF